MRAKKAIILLSMLILLLSGLVQSLWALPIESVSITGEGVIINLTFPAEAHPLDSITHNLTITANTELTMDFTIFIYAPVNSSWQEVRNQTLTGYYLPENATFTSRLGFTLPQQANGTLYCVLNVSTDVNNEELSATLYTTRVNTLTFSEMQNLYNEMLANYTSLQTDYETLLDEYNGLLDNYSSLFANYTALLSQYNALSTTYNDQVATYQTLLNNYNTLSSEYDALDSNYRSKLSELSALQSDYNDLNSTHNSLQANYTTLQADYNTLNQTYTDLLNDLNSLQGRISDSEIALNNDRIVMFIFIITLVALIAFIVYLKRGKEEPYVVIRKETVSMNQDENS